MVICVGRNAITHADFEDYADAQRGLAAMLHEAK